MKKVILGLSLLAFSAVAFAGTPKSAAKSEATTTAQSGTAIYEYVGPAGGDVNNPSNYSNTPITNADDLCQGSGQRCAASFRLDASNHRTGSPQSPTWEKDAD